MTIQTRQRPAGPGRVEECIHGTAHQASPPAKYSTPPPFVGYFEGHCVRAIHVDGREWFAARDVALALGYADPTSAIRSHCRRDVQKLHRIPDALGRDQEVLFLPEADVLRLVVKSKLPAAQRFERWVFEEVLPEIRRTGSFGKPRDPYAVLNDPAAMRGLLSTYCDRVLALQETLAEQTPKVEALTRLAGVDGSLAITDAAKSLQVLPVTLFRWLHANAWIYRRAGRAGWLAYQPRIQTGLLEHKVSTITLRDRFDDYGRPLERVSEQVRVTPKGLARLAELCAKGVLHGR